MLIHTAPLCSCLLPQWIVCLWSFLSISPGSKRFGWTDQIQDGRIHVNPAAAKKSKVWLPMFDPVAIKNKLGADDKALLTLPPMITKATKAAAAAHVFDLILNWLQSVDGCGHSSEPPARGFCSQPANYFQSYRRFQHGWSDNQCADRQR